MKRNKRSLVIATLAAAAVLAFAGGLFWLSPTRWDNAKRRAKIAASRAKAGGRSEPATTVAPVARIPPVLDGEPVSVDQMLFAWKTAPSAAGSAPRPRCMTLYISNTDRVFTAFRELPTDRRTALFTVALDRRHAIFFQLRGRYNPSAPLGNTLEVTPREIRGIPRLAGLHAALLAPTVIGITCPIQFPSSPDIVKTEAVVWAAANGEALHVVAVANLVGGDYGGGGPRRFCVLSPWAIPAPPDVIALGNMSQGFIYRLSVRFSYALRPLLSRAAEQPPRTRGKH